MNSTKPATKTGLCASLADLFGARGSGAPSHRRAPLALATLCALLAALTLTVAPALAGTTHHYSGTSFGPDGTSSTSFEHPGAIAVDQSSHDVYVIDHSAGALYRFNENGEPAGFAGAAPYISANRIGGLTFFGCQGCSQVAANSASGDFYLTSSNAVRAFQADGEPAEFTAGPGEGTSEITGFGELCGVAVDSNGDIYAGDAGHGQVAVYAPSGELLTAFHVPGEPCNLAVDSDGTVYANQFAAAVLKFTSNEFPPNASTAYTEAGVLDATRAASLAVDPATDDVYVDERGQIATYDQAGQRIAEFGATGQGALTGSEGIALDASTATAFASDSGGGSQVKVFGQVLVPTPITEAATAIAPSAATLNGKVNPEGTQLTECVFEYGETTAYGQSAPCEEPEAAEIPADEEEHAVHADVSGLNTGATYHFRLRAATGGAEEGTDASFETPPAVALSTGKATTVAPTSATVGGEIDPEGVQPTECLFEYGEGEGEGEEYPQSAPCTEPEVDQIGAGAEPVPVHTDLAELTPNATYHFRLRAANQFGTTVGNPATFFTKAPPAASTGAPTDVSRAAATLHATVDPRNAGTFYRFAYVPSALYEPAAGDPYAAGWATPWRDAGAGLSALEVSAGLEELAPATTYHFALIASSSGGQAVGADATFTTAAAQPPDAATGAATQIGPTTATLGATVDPDGLETTYHFELGTTAAYGTRLSGSAGSEPGPQAISLALSGLAPATTYHYRILATNADGTATGADATFTTPAFPQAVLPPLPTSPLVLHRELQPRRPRHHHRKHRKRARHANTNRRAAR